MQYNVENSNIAVTVTAANFDVVVSSAAPLEVAIGESAKMDVGAAVNYIKSGEAEITAAVSSGTTAFNLNVSQKTTEFNNNALSKTTDFNSNANDKTGTFNSNASDKTTAFNNNAAAKQAEVDASAALAKQWAIGDPSEPSGYSAKYWAGQSQAYLSGLTARVATIEGEIPPQASSSNQLADKNFVNSSIATSTATFIGTFNSLADLEAYSGTKDDNDYAFVMTTDTAGNTLYNRYKWNGTAWLFEYALNNSSFTSAQWAAINSSATTTNIAQIATNTTAISGKQDIIADLATIRSGAALGATALQPADLATMLETLYPVGSLYIGTQSTCPLATLISGSTWELVATDKALWGGDGSNANTTIAAGLPNVTDEFVNHWRDWSNEYAITPSGGAFYDKGNNTIKTSYPNIDGINTGSYTGDNVVGFDLSRANSIYGNSNTVQPPAYIVNVWRRTA
ncbi:MAG: hypothetical protein J6Y91_02120 [Alphaproteobacteria bacterium]|nr:hypothetical protein [Alphaproteobacteria bacterium]